MQPKTINILYWVFTISFAALMIFSAYSSIIVNEDAKKLIHEQLGYPVYFIPFTGYAKLIGAIVIFNSGIKNNKGMGLCGFVFRSDSRCILKYCVGRNRGPNDVIPVSMDCSGHSLLYFLEEKNET